MALLLGGGIARAQDVTGKITGRVTDKDSGQPLSGVTVIVQGPQGDDATLTSNTGDYYFSSLPVGTYVIRFYMANSSTKTEQGGVVVSADKTVRVNARIAGQAAAAAAEETYVIQRKAPGGRRRRHAAGADVRFRVQHQRADRAQLRRRHREGAGRVPRPHRQRLHRRRHRPREHLPGRRPQRHRRRVRQHQQQSAQHWAADRTSRSSSWTRCRSTPAATTPSSAARWVAWSTRSPSPAPTISTAACSATGHRTSWPAIPQVVTRVNGAISSADQARLRHQRRRRGRRRDHQEQALLLGRLRAPPAAGPRLPLHAHADAAGRQRHRGVRPRGRPTPHRASRARPITSAPSSTSCRRPTTA